MRGGRDGVGVRGRRRRSKFFAKLLVCL
jgi:hypothetical protein